MEYGRGDGIVGGGPLPPHRLIHRGPLACLSPVHLEDIGDVRKDAGHRAKRREGAVRFIGLLEGPVGFGG